MQKNSEEYASFDLLVAGGGISGVLVAHRIKQLFPSLRLAVVEKESQLGGRLRATDWKQGHWGCGLNFVSKDLADFIERALAANPDSEALSHWASDYSSHSLVLAAGRTVPLSAEKMLANEALKAIGGGGLKDFTEQFAEFVQEETTEEKALAKVMKLKPRHAVTAAIRSFAIQLGITHPEISLNVMYRDRYMRQRSELKVARWQSVCRAILETNTDFENRVRVFRDCRIIEAEKDNGLWQIYTQQGLLTTKRLVVAQAPWQMIDWMKQDYLPKEVLSIALKTKPTSLVCLADKVKNQSIPDLMDCTFVKSEDVRAFAFENTVYYILPIDYEVSLDAPSVVKAIKALKRAQKKLMGKIDGYESEKIHLSLFPIAWAQPASQMERKYVEKLAHSSFQSPDLSFCGDAYGLSYNPDRNVISSTLAVCELLSKEISEREK